MIRVALFTNYQMKALIALWNILQSREILNLSCSQGILTEYYSQQLSGHITVEFAEDGEWTGSYYDVELVPGHCFEVSIMLNPLRDYNRYGRIH